MILQLTTTLGPGDLGMLVAGMSLVSARVLSLGVVTAQADIECILSAD